MKAFVRIIFAIGIILFSIPLSACNNNTEPEIPTSYKTFEFGTVSFSYPSKWEDATNEWIENIEVNNPAWGKTMDPKLWTNSSVFAQLAVVVYYYTPQEWADWAATDEDKEVGAKAISTSDNETVLSQKKTTVDGEWAWEKEFEDIVDGMVVNGYQLIIFRQPSMVTVAFRVEQKHWDKLGIVYDTIKSSIAFNEQDYD